MTNQNDSAYPSTTHTADGHSVNGPEYGLTKREYFAGLAMQGLLEIGTLGQDYVGSCAVAYADALIAELNRE